MKIGAVIIGATAAAGYAYMTSRFLCCQGEDGFASNVTSFVIVGAVLLVTAMAVQPAWRDRPVAAIVAGLALFLVVGIVTMLARPTWDSYVFARPLRLGWRTTGVFVVATAVALLQSWLTARARVRRGSTR